jgi:hypothetical protein
LGSYSAASRSQGTEAASSGLGHLPTMVNLGSEEFE